MAIFDRVRPDVVVGYGGYVSMPAYLAARRRKLPLVVHEQNALPGLANKAGARIADVVAVSFPDTKLPKATYVGLPIRRMISQLDRAASRAEAREFFGLDADRPTLLVTGGSQGARRINQAVPAPPGPSARPGSRCCTWSARTARPTPSPHLDLARSVAPTMRESVTSTNVFVHVEATRAAAGLGLLPCFMADRHRDLVRLLEDDIAVQLTYWLVTRPETLRRPEVAAVVEAIKARMHDEHDVLLGLPPA